MLCVTKIAFARSVRKWKAFIELSLSVVPFYILSVYMISVLILTKNEEKDLPGCLESVKWSDDVHVFDSFSTDQTLAIATRYSAKVTQRVFDNWSSHQNWALNNLKFKHKWVLYLDADERVSESLFNQLIEFSGAATSHVAFKIQRRDFAWDGTWLKRSQISPFFLRLFKPDRIRYERLVNPVSVPDGSVGALPGYIDHFPFSKGILFWLQRHIKYAELEAEMRLTDLKNKTKFSFRKALFEKDPGLQRYHQKGLFYKLPCRPLIKAMYMLLYRMSFLDGKAGITYTYLQCIYEYFIILKTRELQAD